jgi:hemerythrin-like metal-binding protein
LNAKPLIDWKDDMAIGIEPFDREHRDLVEAINRLHAVATGPADPAAFNVAVDRLIHITEEHFTHEETVLRHHGCPNLGMHQREHDELLDDVTALRLVGDDLEEVIGMLEMLRDWLHDHIVHFDRGYRGCLDGKVIQ